MLKLVKLHILILEKFVFLKWNVLFNWLIITVQNHNKCRLKNVFKDYKCPYITIIFNLKFGQYFILKTGYFGSNYADIWKYLSSNQNIAWSRKNMYIACNLLFDHLAKRQHSVHFVLHKIKNDYQYLILPNLLPYHICKYPSSVCMLMLSRYRCCAIKHEEVYS